MYGEAPTACARATAGFFASWHVSLDPAVREACACSVAFSREGTGESPSKLEAAEKAVKVDKVRAVRKRTVARMLKASTRSPGAFEVVYSLQGYRKQADVVLAGAAARLSHRSVFGYQLCLKEFRRFLGTAWVTSAWRFACSRRRVPARQPGPPRAASSRAPPAQTRCWRVSRVKRGTVFYHAKCRIYQPPARARKSTGRKNLFYTSQDYGPAAVSRALSPGNSMHDNEDLCTLQARLKGDIVCSKELERLPAVAGRSWSPTCCRRTFVEDLRAGARRTPGCYQTLWCGARVSALPVVLQLGVGATRRHHQHPSGAWRRKNPKATHAGELADDRPSCDQSQTREL